MNIEHTKFTFFKDTDDAGSFVDSSKLSVFVWFSVAVESESLRWFSSELLSLNSGRGWNSN